MRQLLQYCSYTLLAVGLILPMGEALAAAPATTYTSECGSCHIAYPAGFLPSASWKQVLSHLDKHFGDNAEVSKKTQATIEAYLTAHSYDHSGIRRRYGKRFDTPGTPLRVTKTRLFQAMHGEVPRRLVTSNPKVKTFSHCDACHTTAARGVFSEDYVRIPR